MTRTLSRRAALLIGSLATLGVASGVYWLARRLPITPASRRRRYARQFDCDRYNALMPVEEAYERLSDVPNFNDHMLAGLNIMAASEARGTVGLFLLHRHFSCEPDSLMLERASYTDDGWLYLTSPTDSGTERSAAFAPSRFLVSVERASGDPVITPLEFSTDELVIRRFEQIARDSALLAALARFLEQSPVGRYLGIAITERTHRTTDSLAFERTQVEPPASAVRFLRQTEFDIASAIPTIWASREVNGCCSVQDYCEAFCAPAMVGSGHDTGHITKSTGHIGCV